MAELRDYQQETLGQLRSAVAEGARRLVVQMPTGAGKTRLAAEIINGARGKKKRVIFEVPAISLVDQTMEMFWEEGITEVGVIQANHHMTDWSKPIQVASVQTLMKRELPRADVVIRDECHKLFKFDLKWMLEDAWRKIPFIGLSATPWTKGLGRLYERLIVGTTTADLIDRGVLSRFRVFAPSHPDLKDVRTVAGDYHEGDLSEAMRAGTLTADIVATWKAKAEDRPTICFAVDRAHARMLQARFEASGVPAGYVDCMTPLHERNDVRRRFERGEIKVVCNVDVIGIGVDWPSIACISYCRPTKSEMRFVQNIGRGLRMAPGKTDLLVLDHSDTHLRLGFVTEIQHETLNTGKEKAEAVPSVRLPKECAQCGYLKRYGVTLCPNCGHKSEPPAPVKEYTKGELAEFNGKKKRGKSENMTLAQKAIFYAELKAYALQHDYKPGWAFMKYKARFEVKPDHSIADVAPMEHVSSATIQWIRSQNIAWAMSKRRTQKNDELREGPSCVAGNGQPVTADAQSSTPGEGPIRSANRQMPPALARGHENAGGEAEVDLHSARLGMPPARVAGTLCDERDLQDFT